MPRKARNNLKGKYFHIVVQGLNKEYIFDKEPYILKYKETMYQKSKEIGINILAYCIMNNHVHILVYTSEIQRVSKFMQSLNTSYSKFYNKNEKRVGYVFKDRFYTQEIYDRNQLYICLKYIHNNPVKAKKCKKMEDYKYSSYLEFFEEKNIISEESIKRLFKEKENYISIFNFIHKNINEEDDEKIFDIKELDIETFIKQIEQTYKKSIKELKKDKEMLGKIIKSARRLTDVTFEELSRILGISKSTVGNYVKK